MQRRTKHLFTILTLTHTHTHPQAHNEFLPISRLRRTWILICCSRRAFSMHFTQAFRRGRQRSRHKKCTLSLKRWPFSLAGFCILYALTRILSLVNSPNTFTFIREEHYLCIPNKMCAKNTKKTQRNKGKCHWVYFNAKTHAKIALLPGSRADGTGH